MTSSSRRAWRAACANLYHPPTVIAALGQLDRDAPPAAPSRIPVHLAVASILGVTAFALWALHYLRFGYWLETVLAWLLPSAVVTGITSSAWGALAGQGWWFLMHLLWLGLIPLWMARQGLGLSGQSLGLTWADTGRHWRGYVLLAAPILVFVAIASQGEAFVDHYPFYQNAGRSWLDLLAWEALYLGQFVLIEFFFRGFLVNGLRPYLGVNAIYVMCVPYMMIHLPKLPMEALGAIGFGLLLGILALQSRSIWGGVLVHMTIALSMDLSALWQKGAWPSGFWPG